MKHRDRLCVSPQYRTILGAPRDDSPRLDLAAAIADREPGWAADIRAQIQLARLEADAIDEGREVDDRFSEMTVQARQAASRGRTERFQGDEEIPLVMHRGFVEEVRLDSATAPALVDDTFDAFPILHLTATIPAGEIPACLSSRIAGLVTLWLRDANDSTIANLVRGEQLVSLRRIRVQGPMSMRSVELLCEADLPALEELEIWGGTVTNPCDIAASDDWADRNPRAYAIMSRAGAALEQRHGYRKFLHAASRFSVYPCSPAALDILPPLPPERFVRPRQWGDR